MKELRFDNILLAEAAGHQLYRASVPHDRYGRVIVLAEGYERRAQQILEADVDPDKMADKVDDALEGSTAKELYKRLSGHAKWKGWGIAQWNELARLVKPNLDISKAAKLPGWSVSVFTGALTDLLAWLAGGATLPDKIEAVVTGLGGGEKGQNSLAQLHNGGYLTVVPPAKTKDALFHREVPHSAGPPQDFVSKVIKKVGPIGKPKLDDKPLKDATLTYWKGSEVFAHPALVEVLEFLVSQDIKVQVPTDVEESLAGRKLSESAGQLRDAATPAEAVEILHSAVTAFGEKESMSAVARALLKAIKMIEDLDDYKHPLGHSMS